MCLRNTETKYSFVSKFFHWILLVLVFFMFIYGSLMGFTPKPLHLTVYNVHKMTGLVILCLAVLFSLWSLTSIKPSNATLPLWEQKTSRTVHLLIYFCLLAMPLSGWIMATAAGKSPFLFDWTLSMPGIPEAKTLAKTADKIHMTIAPIFLSLIILHVLGALKHHFIDKNNILKRMMGKD